MVDRTGAQVLVCPGNEASCYSRLGNDLRMELLAGDMELINDAEWVPKREEDDWDFEIMNWRGQA